MKFLIVEDEVIIALALKQFLGSRGYTDVHVVHSGEDALAWVQDHRPDVVLMDIFLSGGMDGIETSMSINEKFATPIIFISGNVESLENRTLPSKHAVLAKPVVFNKIVVALDTLLAS